MVIFIAILLIVSLVLALKSPGSTPPNGQGGQGQAGKIEVQTKNGQDKVQVNDVTQNPAQVVTDTVVVEQTADFIITYFPKDQAFLISLLSRPVANARQLAEDEFLKKLDISYGDACKLKATVSIPYSVDENLSGQNYDLSFCPNAKSF